MNLLTSLRRHPAWLRLQLPAALLITLLQRTPVIRSLVTAEELVSTSPLGAVLKSALAATASLGAVHSLAGATTLSTTQQASGQPVPLVAQVGTSITPVGFGVVDTINIMSWQITGSIPPGMRISAVENSTVSLSGPGTLDVTGGGVDDGYGGMIGGISSTTPLLVGTPTTSGTYTITLQAFEFAALSGLSSNKFNFIVNVAATGPTNVAPAFTSQPQAQTTLTAGSALTLTVAATGTPAPTFQWSKNGAAITGATSATFTIPAATVADSGSYTVQIINAAGAVTSNAAVVTVSPPVSNGIAAAITQSPGAQTVIAGATVAFNASASGTPAPTFQWFKDGSALSGQTKPTLILTNVTAANAGSYTVVATNTAGSATSTPAPLALSTNGNFGHLNNLAIFATLTSAVPDFTVATVIGGGNGGTKPLLVRAVGPSLGQLGVGGFVVDPKADLFAGSTLSASNDNWGGDAALSNAFASVGAFSYASASSKDAAFFLPAAASGAYSVKVSGVNGGTGLVLAELYDATPAASFSAATPRFLDVSVLKQIPAGETLTVGFNVGGATSRTVLIRAVGPALGALGVGGTMADPQLQLYSGQTVLASNDNWGGDAQVNAAFLAVGAFGFSDPASKDAVIVATLPPGSYTAVVQGVAGTAGGLTLVEVYDVP